MITRRAFLTTLGLGTAGFFGLGGYAFAIEPRFRLVVTPYRLALPNWLAGGKPLRMAVIADIHACDPWMPLSRIAEIVSITNAMQPDIVVLLGDFVGGLRRFRTSPVPYADWGAALGALEAPLGVHAILGNHDWWTDVARVRETLEANAIPVMENDAVLVERDDGPAFWLAGLGDQLALPLGGGNFEGADDLEGTLAKVTDDQPIIMLAHEPDIFAEMPARVSLALSGHTHGGQVSLPFIGRPLVPSA